MKGVVSSPLFRAAGFPSHGVSEIGPPADSALAIALPGSSKLRTHCATLGERVPWKSLKFLENMAFLKLINLGKKEIAEGKFQDADSFFAEMDEEA